MPERGVATGGRGGDDQSRGSLGPGSVAARRTKSTEVELLQEHTRDKVRRRFTLSVTARFDGTTGKAPMYWWSWPLSVVRCVVSQTAITVVCGVIIKLNGSVDDLRGQNGLYALPTRQIRSMGSPAS